MSKRGILILAGIAIVAVIVTVVAANREKTLSEKQTVAPPNLPTYAVPPRLAPSVDSARSFDLPAKYDAMKAEVSVKVVNNLPHSTPSDSVLMTKLRKVGLSDPNLALHLAREGNERFPKSENAAERTYYIVRSLDSLGLSDEARSEALMMVQKYPTSSFAGEIHRHVLTNPPTHPAERGHGKKYELE